MADFTRREFLKMSVAAIAAAKLAGCSLGSLAKSPGEPPVLARRRLGRTGQDVTVLGLGSAWIAVAPRGGQINTEAQSRAIVETALDGGVRYFDTSPDYKDSEIRLGPALAGWRDKIFLTTKINYGQPQQVREAFTTSLKRLRTDHVDCLLLHGVGLGGQEQDLKNVLGKGGGLDFLREAKKSGQTRFIGMSIHLAPVAGPMAENGPTVASPKVMEATDELDVVMPWVNYVSRAVIDAETRIVQPANKKNIGIVAMKVLAGDGSLAGDYDRAFRYTLSVPGVASAIVGVTSVKEIRRAIQAAKDFRPLTDAEMTETIALGKKIAAEQSARAMLHQRNQHDSGSHLA